MCGLLEEYGLHRAGISGMPLKFGADSEVVYRMEFRSLSRLATSWIRFLEDWTTSTKHRQPISPSVHISPSQYQVGNSALTLWELVLLVDICTYLMLYHQTCILFLHVLLLLRASKNRL